MTLGTVVIGGGSGFIGQALKTALQSVGYNVLVISRRPAVGAMSWNEVESDGLPRSCIAVVNLAGQNVMDPTRMWTEGFKQNVCASRIMTTRLLAQAIIDMRKPPEVFASISGVGYYKASLAEEYDEDSPGGNHDFFSHLCSQWESAGKLPQDIPVRRVIVRSGIVLGRNGGMVQQMVWPFFFGLGGPIGSGSQYMPWIHIGDIVGIFVHALQNPKVKGILNGVSPQLITNSEFVKAFAKALWRPAFIPLPSLALKVAFGNERCKMMTEGQKVIPKRTLESGYAYRYPDIKAACDECAHALI